MPSPHSLFVPGWGAQADFYRRAMPADWVVLQPPSFGATGGSPRACREWLRAEWRAAGEPPALGGHSYGAALAVAGAAAGELTPARLVLVNPAGLPLSKPTLLCLADFLRRLPWFPPHAVARSIGQLLAHPVAGLRLARYVRELDLREQLAEVGRRGIACTVVGTRSDTLTPASLCRQIAAYAGAEYREVDAPGGHLWFLRAPDVLRAQLL